MKSLTDAEAKDCQPYNDTEFLQGMKRLLSHPALPKIVGTLLPKVSFENFLRIAHEIKTVEDFQAKLISTAIHSILGRTSNGLSISGFEKLSKKGPSLFISNHRDIICDPSLFTNCLYLNGHKTPKICLGDNLLVNPLVTDLVKMNKGIIVKRNLPMRELMKWSVTLSHLIREQIENGIDSVWIAQREGRAKDGCDQTHPGVIKMLALSGDGSIANRLLKLHIIPIAISYEFDPCDAIKARELYLKASTGTYQKAPLEDLVSMTTGIDGYKGRIHIAVGNEINEALEKIDLTESKKDQISSIVHEIDRQIYLNYKNWPTNYIAYDLLEGKNQMQAFYSDGEKTRFVERMHKRLNDLKLSPSDTESVKTYYLKNYANSVVNALKTNASLYK